MREVGSGFRIACSVVRGAQNTGIDNFPIVANPLD